MKNAKKDHDLKKWAAEGLAYLSLDGDVKEELVDDSLALKAIVQLAQVRLLLLLNVNSAPKGLSLYIGWIHVTHQIKFSSEPC